MTSSKSTKRALVSSTLAILMCVVMLIGTTFAWFTDSVTNTGNRIQAGNLDIEVEYTLNGTEWAKLDEDADLFGNGLFEPGYTRVVAFRISNEGNLALKYNMSMNLVSETKGINKAGKEFALSDYLKVKTSPIQEANEIGGIMVGIAFDRDASKAIGWNPETNFKDTKVMTSDQVLTAGQQVYFIMQVYMPESVGNEANAISKENTPSIDFGVNFVATQATVESDGFGNDQYDKDATYPVIVFNQQQANDAITNATDKKANISIASGQTITLDNGIANEGDKSRDITFSGDGSQTVDVITNAVSAEGGQLNYQRGSSFTFENLTIQAGEGNFDGIVCDELTFKNCTIKGKLTLYGKATFIDCVFENTMDNQYSIWTWGGTDVTFEDCIFDTNGKAILLYGSANTNLVVNNCTFNDRKNGTAGKAAIEIGNDYDATYTLTVNNATVNGFAAGKNTGSNLWANKNSMDAAHLTVTIDGNKVH
ncbi:right-handed parallel beta-helix repeat-containing protein [Phocea massiliensis]|uniref:Right-handed parallel beta-helix repeat-containing protein n=1 Tax=Merdimmobilis hominis TaxID=2897707 RepID=A0A938X670_9FIRM|nr:right-handed parallel beta-helix repeat-containing protein [Merdimmobilis hominis]MBM6919830.1 right-handed parallel beta-helix repeat-containing protein [Merdimmobilis hominis]